VTNNFQLKSTSS